MALATPKNKVNVVGIIGMQRRRGQRSHKQVRKPLVEQMR
jgi:hypothetical protein